MTCEELKIILEQQKAFFATGATLPVAARRDALKKLRDALDRYTPRLLDALKADLGKSAQEAYMCEVGLVRTEIGHMLKHVGRYAKEKRVPTPLVNFHSRSFTKPTPYGTALIMSPWNYPILLTLEPLVDAIAAGNTAVVKPSAYSPNSTKAMEELLTETFPREYVAVVTGGRQENAFLLDLPFDTIFFTGSKNVGREVLRHAAERWTPVTLELGGKSPCIVDETANIALAAKRIVFGKFLNCGQTCVAPDYIYCAESIREKLIAELKKQIRLQYGENPLENANYGNMINRKHFDRVSALIDPAKTVHGGNTDAARLKIAPTVMDRVTWADAVMGEEIFGPVLPVLTFKTIEEAVAKVNSMPNPLALYIFSSDQNNIGYVKSRAQFGGGCVNDTIIHLVSSDMAFGGVGESGMGGYHGRDGFNAFSHTKSMVDKKTWLDLPLRYQPYAGWKDMFVHMFVK